MFGWLKGRRLADLTSGGPIRVNYDSVAEVAPPAELAALTAAGRHLVLRLPLLSEGEKADLIGRLLAAMPDHFVFDSGGRPGHTQITVVPVVARSRVSERRAEALHAIGEYRRVRAALVGQYRAGTLPRDWRAAEHGGYCCFTSRRTGQVVEAPLKEWSDPDGVDPYFFAQFVRSTAGLEAVAGLIANDYFDGWRILSVVAGGAGPDAEPWAGADGEG